jgi:hypothetical protein
MQTIPLQPVANQIVKVVLGNQNCQILLALRNDNFFADVSVGGIDLVTCVIVRDSVPIVSSEYSGFSGQLMIIDTSSNEDPRIDGLGSRWLLTYFSGSEYALIQQ